MLLNSLPLLAVNFEGLEEAEVLFTSPAPSRLRATHGRILGVITRLENQLILPLVVLSFYTAFRRELFFVLLLLH